MRCCAVSCACVVFSRLEFHLSLRPLPLVLVVITGAAFMPFLSACRARRAMEEAATSAAHEEETQAEVPER